MLLILVAICSFSVGFGAQVRSSGSAFPAPRRGGGAADYKSIAEQRAYIEEEEQEKVALWEHRHESSWSCAAAHEDDLSEADLAMKEASSRPAAAWRALFRAWNGKKVLLGGDSLMDQFFDVASCAVDMMGGSLNLSNRVKMEWARDNLSEKTNSGEPLGTVQIDISGEPWGAVDQGVETNVYTQMIVYQASANVGGYSFTMDYLRHWNLARACRQCNAEEYWEGTGSCSGVCSNSQAFVAKADLMAAWVKQQGYDHMFMNIGHDMVRKERMFEGKMEGKAHELIRAFGQHSLTGSLVLLEHPPQHFNSRDGTGDYNVEEYEGPGAHEKACDCKLANLSHQHVAMQNQRLRQVAQSRGIKLAQIWSQFKSFCDKHLRQGIVDCTHYQYSPELWVPAAEELSRFS